MDQQLWLMLERFVSLVIEDDRIETLKSWREGSFIWSYRAIERVSRAMSEPLARFYQ